MRRSEVTLGIRKKDTFFRVSTKLLFGSFQKYVTELQIGPLPFVYRPFPNILKHRDYIKNHLVYFSILFDIYHVYIFCFYNKSEYRILCRILSDLNVQLFFGKKELIRLFWKHNADIVLRDMNVKKTEW